MSQVCASKQFQYAFPVAMLFAQFGLIEKHTIYSHFKRAVIEMVVCYNEILGKLKLVGLQALIDTAKPGIGFVGV